MPTYPYVMSTSKIPHLFQTVGEKGVPAKVTNKWLEQFGMTSSNDRRLIPVLRFIGFIDDNGVPTERWRSYRGSHSRNVMAKAIRDGYSDLFHAFPNAEAASPDQLMPFFRTHTSLGDEATRKAVNTFRALVGLADFSASDIETSGQVERATGSSSGVEQRDLVFGNPPNPHRSSSSPVVINVNLQLTLPASDNPDVYDALFASLNKHVLAAGSSRDE